MSDEAARQRFAADSAKLARWFLPQRKRDWPSFLAYLVVAFGGQFLGWGFWAILYGLGASVVTEMACLKIDERRKSRRARATLLRFLREEGWTVTSSTRKETRAYRILPASGKVVQGPDEICDQSGED
jgi:hypothetical protein